MEKFEIILKNGEKKELDMSIFSVDNDKQMVNITTIAKACGREISDWLRLPSTKEIIKVWVEEKGDLQKVQVVSKGGDLQGLEQGTWVIREIALDYAMYISPKFRVFCTKALDELFQKGSVSMRLPTTYKEALLALVAAEEERERLVAISEKQAKEIEHKEDVIIGLVKDISLAEKRQRLNQVMRYNFKDSTSMQDRWRLLYDEFEKKFHIDIGRRMKNCEDVKPKIKSKLDYIDRVLEMIPDLYELACKIFENDIEDLKREWFSVVGN